MQQAIRETLQICCRLNVRVGMYFTAMLTFVWGALASGTMCYYAFMWVSNPDSPLRGELALGVGIALLYGIPAWVGTPAAIYWGRKLKLLPNAALVALSIPLAVAIVCTFVLGFLGAL